MFALLPPGGKLGAHRVPFAGSLRYHLGLLIPNSSKSHIFVDSIECVYRDGDDFLFDQTFIHRAGNATDRTRIILFCDVERPMRLWNSLRAGLRGERRRVGAAHSAARAT
jgi:beta-hydroxylase